MSPYNKLLIICGPTATGKTSLGLDLAQKFEGQIVSADSRQVYRHMDIGTGKDVPEGSVWKTSKIHVDSIHGQIGYYLTKEYIKIWGYDLVDPLDDFSVSHYTKVAKAIIEKIYHDADLPIMVGGTGLYIKGVVDGIETAGIPQNKELRSSLSGKTADELFEILRVENASEAASLNMSDRANPHRLIRKIEIADYLKRHDSPNELGLKFDEVLFIGLKADMKFLEDKIKDRVNKRLSLGMEDEIISLLKRGVSWEMQSMYSLGYKQWYQYFEGKINNDQLAKHWANEELKYAKRQMTWFKKDKRINWFDVSDDNYKESVEELVKSWYSKNS